MTIRGLVELESGWWLALGVLPSGPQRPKACAALVLQYDPAHDYPSHGMKAITMTRSEAVELLGLLQTILEHPSMATP